jgi:flavin reductase (DIM6/NTAB) family NADH-FMN oxidoreductase RutF
VDDVSRLLADLLGNLDYPVFIVTTTAAGEHDGCVVGFATQTSIHPVRFLACLSRENRTYRLARDAIALAVHAVPRERRDLAVLFGAETGDEVEKLTRCEWTAGPFGLPILAACPSWLAGPIVSRHDLGDHEGHLIDPVDARHEPGELLYFRDVKDIEPGHPA